MHQSARIDSHHDAQWTLGPPQSNGRLPKGWLLLVKGWFDVVQINRLTALSGCGLNVRVADGFTTYKCQAESPCEIYSLRWPLPQEHLHIFTPVPVITPQYRSLQDTRIRLHHHCKWCIFTRYQSHTYSYVCLSKGPWEVRGYNLQGKCCCALAPSLAVQGLPGHIFTRPEKLYRAARPGRISK